jgi:hypothetical protein
MHQRVFEDLARAYIAVKKDSFELFKIYGKDHFPEVDEAIITLYTLLSMLCKKFPEFLYSKSMKRVQEDPEGKMLRRKRPIIIKKVRKYRAQDYMCAEEV